MTSYRSPAAFLGAATLLLLGACAASETQQQSATDRDPCLGVAPATGTMIVRKADCGAGRQQEAVAAPAARSASAIAR